MKRNTSKKGDIRTQKPRAHALTENIGRRGASRNAQGVAKSFDSLPSDVFKSYKEQ